MQHQTHILAGAIAALLGCAAVVAAQTQPSAMTEAQVTAKLQAAGYTRVHRVEREGSHFDADAMMKGRAVHLHVDANTGAIRQVAHESEEEDEARERNERH